MSVDHVTGVALSPPRARAGWAAHSVSAPFIYALLAPLVLLDVGVSLYQAICFRLWGIKRARRRDHFRFDRVTLPSLTPLQRLNCLYCSYANGLLAFAIDVAARTEQYWCPIQHAQPPQAPHARYDGFVAYEHAGDMTHRIDELRGDLRCEQRS